MYRRAGAGGRTARLLHQSTMRVFWGRFGETAAHMLSSAHMVRHAATADACAYAKALASVYYHIFCTVGAFRQTPPCMVSVCKVERARRFWVNFT